MEPLYEQLLQQAFPDSHSAVQFCRHACAEFGFTVKQEASANRVNTLIKLLKKKKKCIIKIKKINRYMI